MKDQQPTVPTTTTTSYIFGYGSLICRQSRAVTAPTLAPRPAIPVRIQHLERHFSMPVGGWTAMGVQFRHNASCVGVLMPVTKAELQQFDRRELGYDRNLLPLEHVQVLQQQENGDGHEGSGKEGQVLEPSHLIWVYIQQKHVPPSVEHPIAQSYLDIILRGCLAISDDFAKEFITTTKGWYSGTAMGNGNGRAAVAGDKKSSATDAPVMVVHWVNDRQDPLYIRADIEYSQQTGHILDQLLLTHVPSAMRLRRQHFGRSATT